MFYAPSARIFFVTLRRGGSQKRPADKGWVCSKLVWTTIYLVEVGPLGFAVFSIGLEPLKKGGSARGIERDPLLFRRILSWKNPFHVQFLDCYHLPRNGRKERGPCFPSRYLAPHEISPLDWSFSFGPSLRQKVTVEKTDRFLLQPR
jgi:hypothetical protein